MNLIDVVPMPPRLANLLDHAQPTGTRDWFRFENTDDTEATLFVYDEIGWFGTSDAAFAEALSGVTAKRMTVRLNSPGGSVFQGIAIGNLIKSHPAHVTMSVDGLAASIASVIMLAGDEIVVQEGSQVMVHMASGLCVGDDSDMEEMRDLLRKQSTNIARAYASRAGGRYDTWLGRMRAETWFSDDEAVSVGLADRVARYPRKGKPAPDEDEPDMATAAKAAPRVWDLSVFRYAGRDAAPDPMAEPPKATGGLVADDFAEKLRDAASQPVPLMPVDAVPELVVNGAMDPTAIRNAVRDGLRDAGLAVVDTACPSHDTGAEEGTWSKSENEGRLPSPMPVATAKRFYGAYDADRVEDGKIPKDAGHLPHHFVSTDGTPGKASISGVRAALGRLNQTHGLTDADRAAVERHLRGHLPASDDADDRAGPPAAGTPTPEPPPAHAPLTFGRPRPPRTLAFGGGGNTT